MTVHCNSTSLCRSCGKKSDSDTEIIEDSWSQRGIFDVMDLAKS